MPRVKKRCKRKVQISYTEYYYRPDGVPVENLKIVSITDEELEALRLHYLENISQEDAAKKMGVSQSQFQRDIIKAIEKISRSLIEGSAIMIKKSY